MSSRTKTSSRISQARHSCRRSHSSRSARDCSHAIGGEGAEEGDRAAVRRTRPQQWNDAVQTLLALQDQYREWRDALPESLAGSATAELLEQVCDLDLSVLEAVELPRGFGRDG